MKLRGSITVLLSFVLVFVTGLFFTMSEVVRYYCLRDQTVRAAALSCESTLADYCRPLWSEFGILGLDGGYGAVNFRRKIYEDRLSEYMEKNGRSDGVHFFQAYTADSDLVAYSLLTDNGGAGLVREAALHMKENLPAAALSAVRDNSRSSLSEADGLPSMDELLGSGKKAMDAAEENRHRGKDEEEQIPEGLKTLETVDGAEPDSATRKKLEAAENPVDTVGNIRADGILDLVLPEGTQISGASFVNSDIPSKRARHTGNGRGQGPGVDDLVWYRLWQMDKLQSYRHNLGRSGIQYEVEYVICGHDSDRENLKGTVHRILALREAANIGTITSDYVKMGQVEALAWSIAGATANPAIVEAIKAAIIASWAYTESIVDMRRLLAGGHVSIRKNTAEWTTQLYLLSSYISNRGRMATECSGGQSYNDYLLTLLMTVPTASNALRTCDILECFVRQDADYNSFRMDNCMYYVETRENYQASPLFLSYVLILQGDVSVYRFECPQKQSYVT